MVLNVGVIISFATFILYADSQDCKTPSQDFGSCINIKQCPYLLDLFINKRRDPATVNLLKKSQCGFAGRDPKVCCPIIEPTATDFNSQLSVTTELDHNICGRTNVTKVRVVGGSPAELGNWPWMAAIGYRSSSRPGPDFKCGGTLVSDRYVVTASHCVVNIGAMKVSVVRLGDLDLDKSVKDGANPVDIPVENVLSHPKYVPNPVSNDIALIRLQYAPTFNWLIKPLCLPTSNELRTSQYPNRMPFIVGWGATAWRAPQTTRLQEAQVPIIEVEKCKQLYAKERGALIDDRVVCAGKGGKDACQGDSGGPLILPDGNTYYLIGIVSYGIRCAEPNYPGVYTRVAYFLDWLNSNMR